MKRRQMLKHFALATTAAMLLPSCIKDPKKVSIALSNLNVTGEEEELLAAIADTIIPDTDKPGAKTVGAHLFTLVMIDDCGNKESKEKYMRGLRAFDEACEEISGKSFSDLSVEERLTLLKKIDKNEVGLKEDVVTFYMASKQYIIQGYTSSQYFLTEVKPYQLVPGPGWKGCIAVSETPNV
ncbi:gluconate 2-dehydrogenase subunit 3 family protein [Chryseosolibacter indicus]|uniref:Gluconate 2-dehydrogenase subunit 3 family protein n=1 Tax=Chryseosolibacter indicus TaxID=2782351 RepID=A0ABS5VS73_9BACT|nr:gluconate 2-dehydrogenase subunit 3 family protein [Chryseosolibacter indicus]MBT1704036.1 gluconate 2-dehydrogenase subunit 3 family protein [Chryseosolibacter indicus]